ncbi:MAG: UDP-N-acetyl-D-glucosamine 2-epimerase, UDP-hydrolysing [Rhodospirillales bacterium RIFCSPLOWO2_12_FULL_58_28]|nr:MAG: UDP-N-acetyl-D-glucosamine 2-epimerase, UDP-hydrolysing [Rhodospirillales bacterium RIFCSPLOWO2_02_FULL_58_16]OHC76734.1 MAG: UDP-N-acetyl-D-glucosamine 2-epimerase, UDP-hydrolysing [Rhodospirillales bacterium RIFCSPLOWO2_12_FULL_58_28]
MTRSVCVITGSRAEYGLLSWLLREIRDDADLELRLIVTGAHLSPEFGETWRVIEEDGFAINAKVDLHLSGDAPPDIARSMSAALTGMAKALGEIKPDIAVVLGDRFEIFAAAQAAMLNRIPLAHIHGGELSEGAMDDAMRHAVTKMAHLHFVAAEPYRRRVIQLGETPERVFCVGAPGLDNIAYLDLLSRPELENAIGHKLGKRFLLVTYHPVTLMETSTAINELLATLDMFPDYNILITGVNADPGHKDIASRLKSYADGQPDRVSLRASLGQLRYLSAMKHAAAVIGNSSSGIIEAPAIKTPTVNIGERQSGRIRGATIIDCGESRNEIAAAVRKAVSHEFRETTQSAVHPYGTPGVAARIKAVLKDFPLEGILVKRFHDLPAAS